MQRAMDITINRRELQKQYNKQNNITPTSIQKAIAESMQAETEAETVDIEAIDFYKVPKDELVYLEKQLTEQMELAAANLQFEKAAELRDQLEEITDVVKSKKIS
jgi:excinuclease ABC subunit B